MKYVFAEIIFHNNVIIIKINSLKVCINQLLRLIIISEPQGFHILCTLKAVENKTILKYCRTTAISFLMLT
jgi:hypothetical protein